MHLHCFNKVKIVTIYALLVCKIFGLKIRSCKFFYKSQVWVENHDGFGHLYKKNAYVENVSQAQYFLIKDAFSGVFNNMICLVVLSY